MKIFHKNTYTLPLAKAALVAMAFTAVLSSCKKEFLTEAPVLELPEDQAFDSPERVDKLVTGLYTSSKDGRMFGGRYLVYNDIRAEEFISKEQNGVTGYDVYQGTNDAASANVANFWIYGYLSINRANVVIAGLEKNEKGLSPAVISTGIAEAKFIRALNYFALVQIFAKPFMLNAGASRGLPLRLAPETTLANNNLKSSTVAEVYAQILKDLNDAETGLPDTYAAALQRTTRAHKNSAIALKSRVYLAKGDYANVLVEGNKIVPQTAPFTNTVRAAFSLAPDPATLYVSPYTAPESIFSFPMATTNPPGTQNSLSSYYNPQSNALVYYINNSGAGIYADAAWPATDARKVKLTALYTSGNLVNVPVLKKYAVTSPFTDFIPIIRYAEILLNVAEAEAAPGGNATRARELLDAVRRRSDATYNFGTLSTAQLQAAILKERRIELLGEGFRYNDLARQVLPLPSFGMGAVVPVTDSRYTFPIPTVERNTNNLVGE